MSQFVNLNTILGNGKSYQVPIYQRDYSWDSDDWEDLWNDILEIPNEKSHYLGYLVLQPNKEAEESFWIIDGQQRLTTLSLLALAVTALLKKWSEEGIEKENNRIRLEKETERYLGNFSTSKLTISSKLTLNRNNNDYYQSWLLALRQYPALNKLKPSQKLLQKSFNYFYQQIERKFSNNRSGAALTDFLEKTVGGGIVFTQIIVENDLDAFKVFETLNARGVKLSPADLLKNYLFSQATKRGQIDLEEAERRWTNISNILANNDITTYIRHYWNSRYELTRQPVLFKSIKNKITDTDKAFDLLDALEKQAVFYNGFKTPNDEDIWNKEERKHLQVLNLFEVTTCYSLMLSFLENLPRNDFAVLLRELSIISLRYSISQLNPNVAETLYSSVANQIYNKEMTDVRSIVLALKAIYVSDQNFGAAFETAQINTKRKKSLVKYLLIKLENQISTNDYSYEDATATIEHILPENPGAVWDKAFPPDIQEDYIYRLGNYTLLAAKANNRLDNESPFSVKIETYKKSKYKLSSDYCLYDDFTPGVLQQRQERLAKIAKGIWKSAFIQ
jgi:uncharacterized protein with ParB-like and HNH nuclease domain